MHLLFTNRLPHTIAKFFFMLFILLSIGSIANCQLQTGYFVRVARVINGDTFVLTNGERVRLLGVDTPELSSQDSVSRNLAYAALARTRDMIDSRIVKLTFGGNMDSQAYTSCFQATYLFINVLFSQEFNYYVLARLMANMNILKLITKVHHEKNIFTWFHSYSFSLIRSNDEWSFAGR